MNWLGKIIGATFGLMILGPVGALIGFFLGHVFDKKTGIHFANQTIRTNAEVQGAFFNALFSCMGQLAKADGRVTEDEIAMARSIMDQMQLTSARKERAIELFKIGKHPSFNSTEVLHTLKRACNGHKPLLKMFIQFQFQAAYADDALNTQEQTILRSMAQTLGLNRFDFEHMQSTFQAQWHHQQRWQQGSSHNRRQHQYQSPQQKKADLKDAYTLLGVDKESSREQVKKRYRQLMNQYHPDKLVAKGLPEDMMKAATEKTQAIKEAYETITKEKGWRK